MNQIKLLREKRGLTIYDIAKATGFTPSYISNLENGKRTNPSKDAMTKISEALNLSVPEVFFPDEIKLVNVNN